MVIGKPHGLGDPYRNLARYAIEYLKIEEEQYRKNLEEAINCLMQVQADREKRSNPEVFMMMYGVNMRDNEFESMGKKLL